jgi:hypothetical protein
MDIDAIKKQLDNIDNSTKDINTSTAAIRAMLDTPSNTIPVNPGDNLAAIIASAPAGSILAIDPAFVGGYDLVLDKPISLTNKVAPPPGRVSPDSVLPKINGTMVFSGPNVSLIGLSITGAIPNTNMIQMGDNSIIQQCLISGSPNGQHRAVWADAKNQLIQDSYIYNIWMDIDTQAVFCYNGCKGLNVVNCYLEASGENFLSGGADASSVDNIPQSIVFDNCDFNKPLAWKDKIGVKNLFELKCAKGVVLKNSRLTNCWVSGQVGYAILVNVRNQDGAAPFSVIEDVLIDNCTIDNVGAGFSILGTDYLNPSGKQSRLTVSNNHIQLNTDFGAARQVFITGGSDQFKLLSNHFTYVGTFEPNTFLCFDDPAHLSTKFEFDGNEFQEGDYGIFGTGAPGLGQVVLDMYAPGYVCNANIVYKGTSGRNIQYPPCITVT